MRLRGWRGRGRRKQERSNTELTYFWTIKPRASDPTISEREIVHDDEGDGSPLRSEGLIRQRNHDGEDQDRQEADEGGPYHDESATEFFDRRGEEVGSNREAGVHYGSEELAKEVREPDVSEDTGGVVDQHVDAHHLLDAED